MADGVQVKVELVWEECVKQSAIPKSRTRQNNESARDDDIKNRDMGCMAHLPGSI